MTVSFDQFTLRPIRLADAEAYFVLVKANRSRIAAYFPVTVKAATNPESTERFLENRLAKSERREWFTFVLEDVSSGAIIACFSLKDIDWTVPKCEIGYFTDGDYTGKGITSRALACIIRHCFEDLKLNKLFMRIAQDNAPSIRVAEKNGFLLEGILKNDFRTFDNQLIDVLYFGLTADVYRRMQS